MKSSQWSILCRFMICALQWMSHRDPDKSLGSFNYGQLAADIAASLHKEGRND